MTIIQEVRKLLKPKKGNPSLSLYLLAEETPGDANWYLGGGTYAARESVRIADLYKMDYVWESL